MELEAFKTRLFVSILFVCLVSIRANTLQTYIVQLNPQGVTSSSFASKPRWHLSFLEQTMSSEEDASLRLLYSYHSAMEGFAAQLSELELESLKMLPDNVSCRELLKMNRGFSLNYPSISVIFKHGTRSKMIRRRVTNVGSPNSIYKLEVLAPKEVKVRVKPQMLRFTDINQSLSYRVWFISRKRTEKGRMSFAQGQLTWVNSNNGLNRVKSPFSVTWK
ncbi:unnamed protein product [Malus baccata var. baccata]